MCAIYSSFDVDSACPQYSGQVGNKRGIGLAVAQASIRRLKLEAPSLKASRPQHRITLTTIRECSQDGQKEDPVVSDPHSPLGSSPALWVECTPKSYVRAAIRRTGPIKIPPIPESHYRTVVRDRAPTQACKYAKTCLFRSGRPAQEYVGFYPPDVISVSVAGRHLHTCVTSLNGDVLVIAQKSVVSGRLANAD